MTFTEAAVEVLRLAGKPLHYKKITEIAIEKDLLSHVGKTPEITMSSRLATMVKKDRGDAPIVKIKPGVFGLREFPEEILETAKDDSGHDFKLEDAPEAAPSETPEAASEDESTEGTAENDDESTEAAEEKKKPVRKLPGSDVFPEEDDDDEPILANLDDESKDGDEDGGKRRKRRRRRRPRKDEEESGESGEERQERPERPERSERPGRRSRRGGAESGRGRGRGRDSGRGDQARDQGRDSGRSSQKSIPEGDWERLAAETDAVGSDLANAIESALGGRGRQAKSHARIAESLVKKGRLSGDPASLAPTIAAAVRSDQAAREALGLRPRFRAVDGGVALTNWGLPGEAVRAEGDAVKAVTRQRQQVLRAFIRALGDLPAAGFMEILASWLNAEGVQGLRAVRRNSSKSGDFHLAGTLVRGPVELPIALIVSRNGGAITQERVVEVRGALHHYGDAREAWVISLGQVGRDARDEAGGKGAAPVALFDGMALATAMESRGIGLRRYNLPIVGLDEDLLETLRGPGRTRPREKDEDESRGESKEDSSEDSAKATKKSDPPAAAEEGAEATEVESASDGDESTDAEEITPEGDESIEDGDETPDTDEPAADTEESTSDEDDDKAVNESGSDDDDDDDDDEPLISGAKSDDDDDDDNEKS